MGIENIGATCYLAVVVQTLFAAKRFCNDILSPFWSSLILLSSGTAPFLRVFYLLLMDRATGNALKMAPLQHLLQTLEEGTSFEGSREHDAQEALMQLLTIFEDESNVLINHKCFSELCTTRPRSGNQLINEI
eukprot:gene31809-41284_t